MSRVSPTPRQGGTPGKPSIPQFMAPAMPPLGLFTWMERAGRSYLRRHRAERLMREQPQLLDDVAPSVAASRKVDEAAARDHI